MEWYGKVGFALKPPINWWIIRDYVCCVCCGSLLSYDNELYYCLNHKQIYNIIGNSLYLQQSSGVTRSLYSLSLFGRV